MAGFLGVSIGGVGELGQRIRKVPLLLDAAEREATRIGAAEALRIFRKRVTGGTLKVRTGAYRNSTHATAPVQTENGWEATVGVKDGPAGPYAKIHETGGTIRPKKGRLLVIPIGPNLTPAGVARFKSPRDPRMFGGFWKAVGGAILFFVPKGRDGARGAKLEAWFLGVPSVVIPKREPLGLTFRDIAPRMPGITREAVARALGRA